ncbi:MAG: RES family NAD+ phosphorylase [Sulfuricellaceae bacterium]
MIVWRIGTDTPDYVAEDTSGVGAKKTGGRWNRAGHAVIYTAESIPLAVLETLIHLGAGSLPLNRYLVRFDIPDAVWRQREELTQHTAPVGWDALPPGKTSLEFGDGWLKSGRSSLLVVPSVVAPEASNILINPAHPDIKTIVATKVRKWLYDARIHR